MRLGLLLPCCVAAWCVVAVAELRAQEEALRLQPVIPPDSVFSDGQRAVASTAMIPPSSDQPSFLPYPERLPQRTDPKLIAPEEIILGPDGEPVVERVIPDVPILGHLSGPDKLLQQMTYRKTFLPPGGNNLFGVIDIALEAMLSPRRPVLGAPLIVTPYFTFHWFDGTSPFPVAPQTYDTGVEIRQVRKVLPGITADIAVAPSVYTDFHNNQSQAFRVVGRGIAIFDWTPTAQLALGVTYLGRDDIKVLPVGGVLWRPTPRWEIEAIFPRPRVGWSFTPPPLVQRFSETRVAPWLGFSPIQQYWLYAGGELGGNTWAVNFNGTDDRMTYYDLRFVMGIEQRATRGPRGRFEVGYVFDRRVSLLSGPSSPLHDTIMMRGEMSH